jgi:lipopolysaccharide biosynthesis protein
VSTHILYADYLGDSTRVQLRNLKFDQIRKIAIELDATVTFVTAIDGLNSTKNQIIGGHNYIERENINYDFGSWICALSNIAISDHDQLIFINSSILGPLNLDLEFWKYALDINFDSFFVAESFQIQRHFQSYFWRINGEVAKSTEFREFIARDLSKNARKNAIREKELLLANVVSGLGYSTKLMFPVGSVCYLNENPSLDGWKKMLRSGFPFIKESIFLTYPEEVTKTVLESGKKLSESEFLKFIQRVEIVE